MNHFCKINGRVLFVDNTIEIVYHKGVMYRISDSDNYSRSKIKLSSKSLLEKISYQSNLLSRLFRKGIHHLVPMEEYKYALIYDQRINVIDIKSKMVLLDKPLVGSRPLSFEKVGNVILFGEYRDNPERGLISVFSICEKNMSIENIYSFEKIRHIHGIYEDPYTQTVYITTGDEDEESALYKTNNNFLTVEKILSGLQQTRTIKLLFNQSFIFFGSDTPREQNYLYKLDKNTFQLERLTKVSSSVFHGCKINNWLFFSTAIEPSEVNKTKYSEIWASPDGDNWKCIFKFKKDFFSMRYFQYGQIFFPNGPGDDQNLWFSLFATQLSDNSFRIPLKHIENIYNSI